jgi:hypothetical protein
MRTKERKYLAQNVGVGKCKRTGFDYISITDICGVDRTFLLSEEKSKEYLNQDAICEIEEKKAEILRSNNVK